MRPSIWLAPCLRLRRLVSHSNSSASAKFARRYSAKAEPNHYKALGLDIGATQADIKRAFFQLSKEYHPDKNAQYVALVLNETLPCTQNVQAHKTYTRITEAYTVLKDPAKRRLYDEYLLSGRPQSTFTGGGGGGGSAGPRTYDPESRWDSDRYGHRPEFYEAKTNGQRQNRFSNFAIVGFTFAFMAIGVVVQMARFNSHYESTASNLQAMNDEVAAIYAKTRQDAQERGYKEQLRQLREKATTDGKQ